LTVTVRSVGLAGLTLTGQVAVRSVGLAVTGRTVWGHVRLDRYAGPLARTVGG
jgi:hypothetical protein